MWPDETGQQEKIGKETINGKTMQEARVATPSLLSRATPVHVWKCWRASLMS